MTKEDRIFDLAASLKEAGFEWVSDPAIKQLAGSTYCPRAAILRDGSPVAVIDTIANQDIDVGMTTHILEARKVPGILFAIHLRAQAKSALIGHRTVNGFRYSNTDTSIRLAGLQMPFQTLCDVLPVTNNLGWNDLPLSGRDLPHFDDLDSFLSWCLSRTCP